MKKIAISKFSLLYKKTNDGTEFLAKYELFKKILNIKGSIVECRSTQEGGGLFSWAHFSTILEPYNYHRKIIGFDTFEGFKNLSNEDKRKPLAKVNKFKEKYNTYKNIVNCKK